MSFDLGTSTYSLASVFLFALALAQLKLWNKGNSSLVLLIATFVSCIWCVALALQPSIPVTKFFFVQMLEIFKNISWFALLLSILGIRKLIFPKHRTGENLQNLIVISVVSLGIPISVLLYLLFFQFIENRILFYPSFGDRTVLVGFLLTAIIGLVLLEQVIRNTRFHHIWHLKFLCLSLGILFSYDIFLYSNALLFERVQDQLWQARGAIVALATPLIAISVLRVRDEPIQINISRRLVFHTGVLMAAGVYLLLMGLTGFYIREFSGDWGLVLQVIFWVVSLTLLVVLIYSGRMRSFLKLYINRHLFSSKYDYRDEWMRISHTLSETSIDQSPPERVIHALAAIVDSPGGALWLTTNDTYYDQVAHLEMGWLEGSGLTNQDYIIEHLQREGSLIDLNDPDNGLGPHDLPAWLKGLTKSWLLIPLNLNEKLLGIVLLKESRVDFDLNWEDYELMKAAGQQAASYLAQMIASDALSEVRQFSAFNQVSAFVVHDIKTLNSQLSMLVGNAEKHRNNPSFIDDMIKTTEHAVTKMTFLLKHIQSEQAAEGGSMEPLNLVQIVSDVVDAHSKSKPIPGFNCNEREIQILGSEAELKSSIGHLIQNAQEATHDDKSVEVRLSCSNHHAELVIEDTGKGMTLDFINTRLFKPFESTKGVTGMGIGVFQCRSTVRKLQGDLKIQSQPGEGSKFTIVLPLHRDE